MIAQDKTLPDGTLCINGDPVQRESVSLRSEQIYGSFLYFWAIHLFETTAIGEDGGGFIYDEYELDTTQDENITFAGSNMYVFEKTKGEGGVLLWFC